MSDTNILVRLAERVALLEANTARLDARVAVFERASAQHEQNTRQEMAAEIERLNGIIHKDTPRLQAQAAAQTDGA